MIGLLQFTVTIPYCKSSGRTIIVYDYDFLSIKIIFFFLDLGTTGSELSY